MKSKYKVGDILINTSAIIESDNISGWALRMKVMHISSGLYTVRILEWKHHKKFITSKYNGKKIKIGYETQYSVGVLDGINFYTLDISYKLKNLIDKLNEVI
jgi:hypothetical protein